MQTINIFPVLHCSGLWTVLSKASMGKEVISCIYVLKVIFPRPLQATDYWIIFQYICLDIKVHSIKIFLCKSLELGMWDLRDISRLGLKAD